MGKKGIKSELLKEHSLWTSLSTDPKFENAALLIICLNAVWIGVDTDINTGRERPDNPFDSPFFAVEIVFCVLFTFEIMVRLLSYKRKKMFFTDPDMKIWNIFDLVLVAIMFIEVTVLSWLNMGGSDLKMFSTMRLLRLLRISRIFRMVPELGMMVKSMGAAARSVSSTMVLQIGIMYVFAIVMTQWFRTERKNSVHFVDMECVAKEGGSSLGCEHPLDPFWLTLGLSFLSLFQILVYDDTFALIRDTKKESFGYSMVLLTFIVVGAFTVLNMLIGVICEIVSTTKKEEEEKLLMQKVEELFEEMDSDGSGTISRDEFEAKTGLLEKLGLDQSTIKLAFELIDDDRSGSLEMQEFLHMVFRLLHPPTSQDLLCVKRNLAKLCDALGCDVFDAPPPMALKGKKKSRPEVKRSNTSPPSRIAFEEEGRSTNNPGSLVSGGGANAKDSPVGRRTQSNVEAYSMANVEEKIKNTIMEAFAELQYAQSGQYGSGGAGSNVEQSLLRIEGTLQTLRDKLQVVRKRSEVAGNGDSPKGRTKI